MPGSIKIDDGSGNYTILTNAGSLGSDKTLTVPNSTGTLATTAATNLGGLVFLSGATISTLSSSIEVDSVFSSSYDNYKIHVVGNTASSNNVQVQFQMRASSSNTTTNYKGIRRFANVGASSVNQGEDTGTSYWYMGDITSDQTKQSAFEITLYKPNLAEPTNYVSNGNSAWSSSDFYSQQNWGVQTDNTQFDGFRFLPKNGSHTFSLTYKIYGITDS